MDVVWLKRDVRLQDHEPLRLAVEGGRSFIILFLYEPDQLAHETVHASHVNFVNEGLAEIDSALQKLSHGRSSARVTFRRGEAVSVLQSIHSRKPLVRLLSHQETGHGASFSRDKRVARWCKNNGVQWTEIPQSTVVRGIGCAGGSWLHVWKASLESFLASEALPDAFSNGSAAFHRLECIESVGLQAPTQLGITHAEDRPARQHGGERRAHEVLQSFLRDRCEGYSGGISSPNSAWTCCSRLSPYLAWGHISIRTVWQAVEKKRKCAPGKAARSLNAFLVRFQWRGHNCQRFEMRCWMEHRSLCEAWEHLRQGRTFLFGDPKLLGELSEEQRIEAFQQGRTGYPMVDACMRCLLQTGWLNFRMRCMLVSFGIFSLWLDWRAIASHMARCFLDYEPGIHYSQLQMQAGTTGVDMRCYAVTKQAKEHDPKGVFIRKYVAELTEAPVALVHEPWKWPAVDSKGYPARIVDELKTSQVSKKVMSALQKWAQQAVSGDSPPSLAEINGDSAGAASKKKRSRPLATDDTAEGSNLKKFFQSSAETTVSSCDISQQLTQTSKDSQDNQTCVQLQSICAAWSCTQCTLINVSADMCQACDAPRPPIDGRECDAALKSGLQKLLQSSSAVKIASHDLPKQPTTSPISSGHAPATWSCTRCTLINTSGDACEVCDAPRPPIDVRVPGEVTDLDV
eukprot:TRINITY_DN61629_c0_g1_i1.p1 TRINITY_DN61629_c0_g1~~TRINITY_DN61629_c0_g1_i1.p1  ORF type:complete len:685 (-),score=74.13 TRINITY_DN61629_c0_g1_i1:92-2146(-)